MAEVRNAKLDSHKDQRTIFVTTMCMSTCMEGIQVLRALAAFFSTLSICVSVSDTDLPIRHTVLHQLKLQP